MPRILRLAALIVATAALSASAQTAPEVRSVDFEGLRIHTADEVRLKMETHVGRPYSREALERDIRRLAQTGWFSDVRKSSRCIESGPDAAVIILEVLENDVLREIKYIGNREFDDQDLAEGALLKTGEYFAPYKVKLDADRIRDKYVDEGYAMVKVDAQEAATGQGTVVTFTVREGPHVHVSDIYFHGNVNLSDYQLGGEMQSKERTLWSLLSPPTFKERLLDEDMKLLERFARGEGYLDARVYVRELVWNEDKSEVDIHIEVEEGIQYILDSVTIEGNTLISTAELSKGLKLSAGEPYALKNVDFDEQLLTERYREKAYIDSDATAVPSFTEERGHVRLTWRIKESKKIYVGRIDFVGNDRTQEKVMRREMRLLPGEEFNKLKLDRGINRIRGLGYFEPGPIELILRGWAPSRDPVVVVEVVPGDEKDVRDLLVHVQEGRTGNFKIGGSFSDESGISGLFEMSQNNFDIFDLPKSVNDLVTGNAFAGAGQNFQITIQPGYKRSRYEMSFTEPWIFDYPVAMTHAITFFDQDVGEYREKRLGTSIDFARHWDDFAFNIPGRLGEDLRSAPLGGVLQAASYAMIHIPGWFIFDDAVVQGYEGLRFWERNWTVGVGYRFARITISDIVDGAATPILEVGGTNFLSSVTWRVSLDRRNDTVFPSHGFITAFSFELAGHPLGGDFNFFKFQYRHAAYTTLWTRKDNGKIILATDIRAGFAQPHYVSDSVPIFERFFAGGRTLRGFEARTISPKENGDPVGGNIQLLASAEVSFPIIRPEILGRDTDVLRGAFFTDWGTVVARPKEFGQFRWSVGFGVRLQIPLGGQTIPITVDFGFPIRKESGDERQVIQVGFDFGF